MIQGKRVGITGGIACGKSTVGQLLQERGFPVVDADALVHQALAHDAQVHEALRKAFGNTIFDLDTQLPSRTKLAARIFENALEKQALERILHPVVRRGIQAFFEAHESSSLMFALVPLIFETDTQDYYDEVWCVASLHAQQIERMKLTRGMDDTAIQARLNNQLPLQEKMSRSHRTLYNHADMHHLQMEVDRCIKETLLNQPSVSSMPQAASSLLP
jgi:dephospho-CoA kinase